MKSIVKKSFLIIIVSTVFTAYSVAQPHSGRGNGNRLGWNESKQGIENVIPDLTDDQITALKELRIAHMKEMKDFKNQMGELKAKERTLMSADPIDQNAAEKLVDQKTDLLNKQMKAQVSNKVALQEILTEEQMLIFDQHRRHGQMAQRNMQAGNCPGRNFGPNHPNGNRANF